MIAITRIACLCCGLIAAAPACGWEHPASQSPNLIVILADDLGYSDLGCYGGEIATPHLDALAAGGLKMTQVYNSARCCPSRASLMTGLYPTQAGIGDFTTNQPDARRGPGYLGRLNDKCATLAEALRPAGYQNYYVGKWHLHPETGPIKRGFDEFYGYVQGYAHDQYDAQGYQRLPVVRDLEVHVPDAEFYATDVFNQYAVEFIKQGQASDQPWFLFLAHSSPHFPVQAPADRADRYDAVYQRGWDRLREERFARMKQLGLIDGPHWQLSSRSLVPVDREDIANAYSGQPNPAWDSLSDDRQRDLARRMAIFAAMVEGVDQGVGQIVEHLRSTDDLDNTLILFLSDNGACYEWGPYGFDGPSRKGETHLHVGPELAQIGQRGTHQSYGSGWANLGDTPFRMYKHFTHEGGICTPLIAHWPQGLPTGGSWIRTPSHVMDVMPTLLEAAGASYPRQVDGREITPLEGRSLLPALRGESQPDRTLGFDHQGAHAIRQGDWKAVWSKRMPHEIQWELYDLAQDRCELNNLAEQAPRRLAGMVEAWDAWARRVGVKWQPPQEPQGSVAQPPQSPAIANRELTIEARVRGQRLSGVALAQGGRQHGYAVHLIDGQPAFDVRVNGKVTRLLWPETVSGTVDLRARLTAEQMTLQVNRQSPQAVPSPGLIPIQPVDALSLEHDERTAAGDYEAPHELRGKLLRHSVTSRPPTAALDPNRPRPPNFVFVITDDVSPHDLEIYGHPQIKTP